ncbi:hypothetical protein C3942_13895 [Solimonas fluminis]|uniref:DUF378 domain-containing protein n=1 Tax=Solimonas fluminis TaxID=2086571 RepID=A0A2S5TEU1_9GAMM|nr:hypothetical protein C3942_13895 [Solimonas fluminis]
MLSAFLILFVGNGIHLLIGDPYFERARPETSSVRLGWIFVSIGVGAISLIWWAHHENRMTKKKIEK